MQFYMFMKTQFSNYPVTVRFFENIIHLLYSKIGSEITETQYVCTDTEKLTFLTPKINVVGHCVCFYLSAAAFSV